MNFWTIILPLITVVIQIIGLFNDSSIFYWVVRILAIVNIISCAYFGKNFAMGCWIFTAGCYWLMLILFHK